MNFRRVMFYKKKEKRCILKYINGYINIFVEGVFLERFINICKSKNIFLWNIKHVKSTIMYANISVKDFKKLRGIVRKTRSRVSINYRRGLPFFLNRYKKRKIFILCLIFLMIVLIVLSQYIWNIEIIIDKETAVVYENNEEDYSSIINDLEEAGLKIGKLKKKANINSVINAFRLKRNDIAWVGINIKGTNAIVNIVYTNKKPSILDDDEYCNIIASKNGIIYKIIAQDGTQIVKEGQLVKKGERLIAGWVEGKFTGREAVHSRGEVKAKVWYRVNGKECFIQSKKIETGRMEEKYEIKFNNFKINLYKVLTNFEKCDKIIENKKLKLFSNFYLPIEIIKIINKEYEIKEINYTDEELKKKMLENMTKEIFSKIQIENKLSKDNDFTIEVTDKKFSTNNKGDFLEAELVYEVLEDIGIEEKLNMEEVLKVTGDP